MVRKPSKNQLVEHETGNVDEENGAEEEEDVEVPAQQDDYTLLETLGVSPILAQPVEPVNDSQLPESQVFDDTAPDDVARELFEESKSIPLDEASGEGSPGKLALELFPDSQLPPGSDALSDAAATAPDETSEAGVAVHSSQQSLSPTVQETTPSPKEIVQMDPAFPVRVDPVPAAEKATYSAEEVMELQEKIKRIKTLV